MRADFLPPRLLERTRPLGPVAPRAGAFVLYWVRCAMRAEDNPALDVALLAARALGRPLFVYQGLSERYRFASDRHHTFVLEGARDFAAALKARGIGHAFALERPGHRGGWLRALAADAALVVTEDVPVAPFAAVEGFSGWDAEVAKAAPVWRVDASCVVPFRFGKRPDRALTFRAERQPRWEAELAPWPMLEVDAGPFLPELPFAPVDLAAAPLEELVAACEIDHAVAPVPQLRGGTTAALARWSAFLATALAGYADAKDDPLAPAGRSRLSAYLHYGMVSPWRLARDVRERGGPDHPFLDELLVWRELAWSFCAHEPRHATVEAVPAWARETLHRHEGDERELPSSERLRRAQTGERLWDAAQRSLLTHGELHHALRGYWGKRVLGWTRDAAHALEVVLDLNHRYALDGRDPASHLGALWCLGAFDRALDEQPVFGHVRPPHPPALDLAEYSRRTRLPARGAPLTVAVVGAGVAGAACARALVDAGHEVTIFERGDDAGGRCSTRVEGEAAFDPGAPGFAATDARWRSWVDGWEDEGAVARWGEGFVGAPTMSSLLKRMLHGLDARLGVDVSSAEHRDERWRLVGADGHGLGEFEALVVAAPAPEAAALLRWSAPELASLAESAVLSPRWTLLLALDAALDAADVLEVGTAPFERLLRQSARPGRPPGERWVAHATAAWSRVHLEEQPEAVAAALLDAFWAVTGGRRQQPRVLAAHRWRYARVEQALKVQCLFAPGPRVAACGDWCLGDGVEAAFLSGTAAAGRILSLSGAAAAPTSPPAPGSQLRLL